MLETVNYQCPACGGPLHYSDEAQQLKCDYCDSTFDVQKIEQLYAEKQNVAENKAEKAEEKQRTASGTNAPVPETAAQHTAQTDHVVATGAAAAAKAQQENLDPVQAYLNRANWDDEDSETLSSSVCSSCGAELIHDQTTAVTQCPYCGNNAVIPGTMAGTIKPDYVIPFKVSKEKAVAALKKYYEGKKFLPNSFAQENHLQEIQGVYVPFWLYTARADAQASFDAQNVRSWRQGDYQITETDFYRIERAGYMDFSRIPVDGSQKMPDAHMDSIEPFDYSELAPFSVAYLPGYLTDRFDMDVSTCQPRATQRMENTATGVLRDTVVGYSAVESTGSNVNATITDVSYALMPVWMLHTKWNGKDFLFAMNGQTGKFIGDLPIDKGKVASWFLRIFIPSAIAVGAAAFLLL